MAAAARIAPLPAHAVRTRSRQAADLRDAVAKVTPHEVTALQPELDGVVGTLALPHSRLVFVRYGGSVVVEAPATERRVVATVPLGPMHVTVGSAARGRVHTAGFSLSRQERTLMRPDPWAGALVLAADEARLAEHQAVVLGRQVGEVALPSREARASAPSLTHACRQAWQAAASLAPDAGDGVVAHFLQTVEDELLTALVLSWGRSPIDVAPRGSRRVPYLREWLESHHEAGVTTTSMARELGISVRQLQYAVLSETGLTPGELLRETRLRHARQMLRVADCDETTVSAVALACGFAHLGRFSAVYAARYGETPSATLRSAS